MMTITEMMVMDMITEQEWRMAEEDVILVVSWRKKDIDKQTNLSSCVFSLAKSKD